VCIEIPCGNSKPILFAISLRWYPSKSNSTKISFTGIKADLASPFASAKKFIVLKALVGRDVILNKF
jgi:hypothetical protein